MIGVRMSAAIAGIQSIAPTGITLRCGGRARALTESPADVYLAEMGTELRYVTSILSLYFMAESTVCKYSIVDYGYSEYCNYEEIMVRDLNIMNLQFGKQI